MSRNGKSTQEEREGTKELSIGFSAELEQLVYLAIHGLRSPLNASSTLAQLLLKRFGEDLNPEARWMTEQIVGQLKGMATLLVSIHDFALVAGQPTRAQDVAHLDNVIATALANLEGKIQETGTQIEHWPMPVVSGNEAHLTAVFQHVIANSIHYRGTAPPRIKITTECRGNECTVSFVDNGIGFGQEYSTAIFEPFKRLHSSALPGSGLGLAISKKIIEQHRGRIWAESKPEEGAAIYIQLPLCDAVTPKEA